MTRSRQITMILKMRHVPARRVNCTSSSGNNVKPFLELHSGFRVKLLGFSVRQLSQLRSSLGKGDYSLNSILVYY